MAKKNYKEKLRVLFVTSELTPIAKAGGLGDVVGQLPKEMARKFHIEIRIIMPKYKFFDLNKYPAEKIITDLKIASPTGGWWKVSVWKTYLPETIIPVYLIENNEVFNGDNVYNHKQSKISPHPYFFLSKVALELIKIMDWQPNIIHCHDGMMGLVPKLLKTVYKDDPFYQKIASVLTIHNLIFQPWFEFREAKNIGLKQSDFKKTSKFLKIKVANIMAEAIANSDMINTVSITYAKEVLTKKFGAGMQKLLRTKKKQFTGILNGVDYSHFDPRNNPDVPVKYWIDSLDKKSENKLYLQKKVGLTQSVDIPLICVISRLTDQKGIGLVEDVLKDLVDMGAQFVILGSGGDVIEKIFIKAEKDHPKEIAAEMKFDADFAQTIYAGSDMILMPSRFEPCGLSQIIAMRFGTIPIVRHTGGLADTVKDGYTGFVFENYDKSAFLWAISRAVDIYYNQKDHWRKMQEMAMKKDFSWKNSAKKYIWLYSKAISNHKKYLEGLNEQ